MEIARQLDPASRRNLRLTCKNLEPLASETVTHVKVERREDLEDAIKTYKKGGIVTLTVTDPNLTDDDLLPLKNLPGLERLNLCGCKQLTNAGLPHLHSLEALQQLNLRGCIGLTNDGVERLRNQLTNCAVITGG